MRIRSGVKEKSVNKFYNRRISQRTKGTEKEDVSIRSSEEQRFFCPLREQDSKVR